MGCLVHSTLVLIERVCRKTCKEYETMSAFFGGSLTAIASSL